MRRVLRLWSVFLCSAALCAFTAGATTPSLPAAGPSRPADAPGLLMEGAASPSSPQTSLNSSNLAPARLEVLETPGEESARQLVALAARLRGANEYNQARTTLRRVLDNQPSREVRKAALLELIEVNYQSRQLAAAQQACAEFVRGFRDDEAAPEVLLRQGLVYREMGAPQLAITKFYAVMSSALMLKSERLPFYQRLVLRAQTEIADTYQLEGRFPEAADFYQRLLKLDSPDLKREEVTYKLVSCLASSDRTSEAYAQAELFLSTYPDSERAAEVRFLAADSLKRLGRKQEALQRVIALLEDQRARADQEREQWVYWQRRAGNAMANYLYEQGEFVNCLEVYLRLSELEQSSTWRLPALYQAGLVYEKLEQPGKASELYRKILAEAKSTNTAPASLGLVTEMAQFREQRLAWKSQAEQQTRQLHPASPAPDAAKPDSP